MNPALKQGSRGSLVLGSERGQHCEVLPDTGGCHIALQLFTVAHSRCRIRWRLQPHARRKQLLQSPVVQSRGHTDELDEMPPVNLQTSQWMQ